MSICTHHQRQGTRHALDKSGGLSSEFGLVKESDLDPFNRICFVFRIRPSPKNTQTSCLKSRTIAGLNAQAKKMIYNRTFVWGRNLELCTTGIANSLMKLDNIKVGLDWLGMTPLLGPSNGSLGTNPSWVPGLVNLQFTFVH